MGDEHSLKYQLGPYERINDKGVCKTAPPTQGMLTIIDNGQNLILLIKP